MPYQSEHFTPAERECHVPPWGLENPEKKEGLLTTNTWVYRGLQGLPAKPLRNHTTNHFDPQNWRSRSDYREKFFTPPSYSRHGIDKASPFRNHKPHASIEWPLEPNKSYMIWKQKPADASQARTYTAPSLLRHFKENKWRTTNQSTYQNYFGNIPKPSIKEETEENLSRSMQRQSQQGSVRGTRESAIRPATDGVRPIPVDMRTMYAGTYNGEPGKPSTSERPPDNSWRNIKY